MFIFFDTNSQVLTINSINNYCVNLRRLRDKYKCAADNQQRCTRTVSSHASVDKKRNTLNICLYFICVLSRKIKSDSLHYSSVCILLLHCKHTTMQHDVFISYSRKDTEVANRICKAFDEAGIT